METRRMRKVLTLALALGAAVAIGVAVGVADENAIASSSGPTSAVSYESMGPGAGILSIAGSAGSKFRVFDCMGMPVVTGTVAPAASDVLVPNSGPGPDGNILHVVVDADYHPVAEADPNWEWE